MMDWSSPYLWFGGFIILIYIPGFIFFFYPRGHIKTKKFLWPIFIILLGLAFEMLIYFLDRNPWALSFLAFFIAIICYLNIRCSAVFCDSCGRADYSRYRFTKPTQCPNCGAKLD